VFYVRCAEIGTEDICCSDPRRVNEPEPTPVDLRPHLGLGLDISSRHSFSFFFLSPSHPTVTHGDDFVTPFCRTMGSFAISLDDSWWWRTTYPATSRAVGLATHAGMSWRSAASARGPKHDGYCTGCYPLHSSSVSLSLFSVTALPFRLNRPRPVAGLRETRLRTSASSRFLLNSTGLRPDTLLP